MSDEPDWDEGGVEEFKIVPSTSPYYPDTYVVLGKMIGPGGGEEWVFIDRFPDEDTAADFVEGLTGQ